MATQIERARQGELTPQIIHAARSENTTPEQVRDELAAGRAVLPANPAHTRLLPTVVGRAFRTKVNCNIGRSALTSTIDAELEKLQLAIKAGTDCLMDLSVGPDLTKLRLSMLTKCTVPFGTVPIYEALSRTGDRMDQMTPELLVQVIREQAEEGVDFMTIHAGLLTEHIDLVVKRVMGIVSRGGAIMAEWMLSHRKQNPFYTAWDQILDICHEHDVTVSLGDALRPGCLADASDEAQFAELKVLGELVHKCRSRNVQVMVEGPGHIPFNQIQMNMEVQQKTCDNAPFYVLGPVVTDIAPGYDHITSSIGATAAAYYGASLLCYVTPAEHLCLPSADDVRQGIVAYRIAAHAADVARNLPGARDRDDQMAKARMAFDWNKQFSLALDGETARKRYEDSRCDVQGDSDHCTMCGREFCAIRTTKRLINKNAERLAEK